MLPRPMTFRLSSFPSLAIAAACLVAACGSGGGGASEASPASAARILGKATYVDRNADGSVDAGDVITCRFDRDVLVRTGRPMPFATLVDGDSLGAGCQLEPGDRADEVRLLLGTGARLRVRGRFADRGQGSPSALSLPVSDAIVERANLAPVGDAADVDLAAGFVVKFLAAVDGQSVAAGDLDGDGDLDLVVARDGAAAAVFENDGAAGFTAGQQLGEGRTVALADVDRDGDLDAVVGSDAHATTVWRNDAGVFTSVQSLPTERTVALAVGDLDGDGDDDLVRGNGPADPDSIWWNDGAGTFTYGGTVGEGNTHAVTLADVDGDGDLDLLQARSGPSRVWINDGNGVFTAGQTLGSGSTRAIAAADFDCDGDLDLLTAGRDPSELWRNDGSGGFTSTGRLVNAATDAVRWFDCDGDGRLDVYAANANGQDDELWYVDSQGVLRHSGTSVQNGTTHDAVVGDFDGDGDLDVITIGGGQLQILVSSLSASHGAPSFVAGNSHLGQGAALDLVAADFDRDGDLDLVETMGTVRDTIVWTADGAGGFTAGPMLGAGGTHAAAGDVDGDGDVDLVITGPGTGIQSWRNGGAGLAGSPTQISGNGGRGLLLHDVDRDGDLDLLHVRGTAGQAELWRNDGAGAFTLQVAAGLPTGANAVAVADVDRDGDGDLLFATAAGLVVAQNVANGTFPASFAVGSEALDAVAVGDVDRDGDTDVAVGGSAGHAIWRNLGGAFPTPAALAGAATRALVLVDLDRDGDLDLLRGGDGADDWWRNDAGTFVAAALGLSAGPTNDFVVLDFGCDGDLDVVVADGSSAGGFRVYLRQ